MASLAYHVFFSGVMMFYVASFYFWLFSVVYDVASYYLAPAKKRFHCLTEDHLKKKRMSTWIRG